jgi:periplasmic protein TonB
MDTALLNRDGWGSLLGLVLASAAVHVAAVVMMPTTPAVEGKRTVEMELYVPPPPPPPPKEEPPRELEPPKAKPPPVPVVELKPKPPPAPPPPNDTPPPEPTKPVPLVVGITMSSTTATGGFAVQVGNTTYGKASDTVVDPSQVKAYSAPRYLPPGGADTEPQVLNEVKVPYPQEAKKNEVEGSVRLKVTLEPSGEVKEVVVISGPGYGLNEAAREALRRFRFKPATKGGEPVGYTFIYTYTFELD